MTTLEKIRKLEEYLTISSLYADPMIENTIDKLLFREYNRIDELRKRLTEEVAEFEKKYAMNSDDFYRRYESGGLGDDTDFMEWSATIDMLNNVRQQLYLLRTAGNEPTYH